MKKLERKINGNVYFLAVILTTIFFILGAFIGHYLAEKKANEIEISQKAVLALFDLSKIKGSPDKENLCNLSWDDVWKEKVEIGEVLTIMEARVGKDNEVIKEQKKIYHEVQIKTLDTVKRINDLCGEDWTIILFFYNNNEEEREKYVLSGIQGSVLNTLYSNNPEDVKVFSFDINIGEPLTKGIIDEYGVDSAPFLIINDISYDGFRTRDEIEKIISG